MGWCAATEQSRWDVILACLIGVGGWYGCAVLPPETVTGGMKLGYVWSQELSLILLAWVAFIGASMATRAGRHIQVDALSKILPASLRPWTRALGLLVSALFCAYLTYLAYEHLFSKPAGDYWTGEIRPATRLPAWIIILSALVSFGLMTARFGALCVDAFIDRKIPEQEVVH
jgi:TRAP-type C4-dicarboxylate transport system permease small subunit